MFLDSKLKMQALWVLYYSTFFMSLVFWGTQSVLVVQISQNLPPSIDKFKLFGSVLCFSYGLAIVSGYMADQYFGYARTSFLGAVAFVLGCLCLTRPVDFNIYLGLSLNCLGYGLMSPNRSTLMNSLFTSSEEKARQKAFTHHYAWTNLGALMGPFLFGFVSTHLEWSINFRVVLFFAMLWFFFFSKVRRIFIHPTDQKNRSFKGPLILVSSIPIVFWGLKNPTFTHHLLIIMGGLVIGYFSWNILKNKQRTQVILVTLITALMLFFYAIYFQLNCSLLELYEKRVDRILCGFEIPVPAFAGVEPLFVVLLAPWLGIWLSKIKGDLTESLRKKIMLAFLFEAVAFGIFAWIFDFSHSDHIFIIWPMIGCVALACGEIAMAPAASAAITALAPAEQRGVFVSLSIVSLAYSGSLAGTIATFISNSSNQYSTFGLLSMTVLGVATILYVMRFILKKKTSILDETVGFK